MATTKRMKSRLMPGTEMDFAITRPQVSRARPGRFTSALHIFKAPKLLAPAGASFRALPAKPPARFFASANPEPVWSRSWSVAQTRTTLSLRPDR